MDKYVTRSKRTKNGDAEEAKKAKSEEVTTTTEAADAATTATTDAPKDPVPASNVSIKSLIKPPLETLTTEKMFDDFFVNLADLLLNNTVMMVNGQRHRFLELEVYLTSSGHNDPFTHCDDVQKTCGNWYFHKTRGTYRAGTYKGLDISIGNSDTEWGGVLIRTIEGPTKVVCGPCLSVDHILAECKVPSIKDLVDTKMKGNISVEKDTDPKPLYLQKVDDLTKRTVYRGPRVGLHMNKAGVPGELQKKYVFKSYRFFTEPKKIKKGTNITILGMYHNNKMTPRQIADTTGCQLTTVEKWISVFEAGKKVDGNQWVGGKMSDDEVAKCYGALSENYY